jgi:hypothetical protein
VRDDAPAEPVRIGLQAGGIDDPGDLAARRHRQFGQPERPYRDAAPDQGVEQVHAGCLHRDADLAGTGLRVSQLLVAQVRGRAELVLPNGVHSGTPSTSPAPRNHGHRNDAMS